MKEVRLQERCRGFYDALMIFEDVWRKRVWKTSKIGANGLRDMGDETCVVLWAAIEEAQAKIRDDEWEYKDMMLQRRYGEGLPKKD